MFRRRTSTSVDESADARAALKAALDLLARSRGVPVSKYPHCIRLVRDLRDEADHWLVLFVRGAVERGHSWSDVGEMLGVSRQAAHERFAPLIMALAGKVVGQETSSD